MKVFVNVPEVKSLRSESGPNYRGEILREMTASRGEPSGGDSPWKHTV